MTTRLLPLRLLLGVVLGAVLAIVPATVASAGGWAATTLDEIPEVQPGQATPIGFTIRQHGVTPTWVDGDVAIVATSPSGVKLVFPGVRQGSTGHYVATVTLPTAGTYRWEVRQGGFAPQDLGELAVGQPVTATAGATHSERGTPLRLLLPLVGLGLVGFVLFDTARRRRRPATA